MKSSVHLLNVNPGSCTIIQHESGRMTMIDICNGWQPTQTFSLKSSVMYQGSSPRGDFKMKISPTNPLEYLHSLGIQSIFRFILSHPDMDHMDGLDPLLEKVLIENFWLPCSDKIKPIFSQCSRYHEKDWDIFESLKRSYKRGEQFRNTCILAPVAGNSFKFANADNDEYPTGDSLYILAPDKNLRQNPDVNDTSYVILYDSPGGKILIPGDADDKCWEYVLKEHGDKIKNCSFLLAPHHGRDSGRSYEFLSYIQPELTLFGSAPSAHLAYNKWKDRGLECITTNQVGNTVLEIEKNSIDIYIENDNYAQSKGLNLSLRNKQGFVLYDSIKNISKPSLSEILNSLSQKGFTKEPDNLSNILYKFRTQEPLSNILDELLGNSP